MSASRQQSGVACAACKHQKRKCSSDCILARYFPQELYKEFVDVHRLFGVSNVIKLCNSVSQEHRDIVIQTITYEAEMRRKDPVQGIFGIIRDLLAEIESTKKELQTIQQQIMLHKNLEETAQMMKLIQQHQNQFDGLKEQLQPSILFDPVRVRK